MTFLLTVDNLFWAKAPQISPSLPVEIGLHAYADYTPKVASFTARSAARICLASPSPPPARFSRTPVMWNKVW